MRKFALYAGLTVIPLGVGAVLVAGAYFEPRVVFTPSPAYSSWTRKGYEAVEHGRTRSRVEDVWLTTADGARIHAWFMSPRKDRGRELPVVLWFHGNAGNVGRFLRVYEKVVALSAHVFAVDYRGYGHSEGTPSEEGVYRDADAAWDYLTRQQGIPPEHIIIYGFSLGGAVAVDLASRVKPGGLVVQSSFTSIPELAQIHYPLVPGWLIRNKMDSLAKISEVRCPKLFIHSTGDRLIPYSMARRLYEAAPGQKEFLVVKGAGHSQTFSKGGKELLKAIRRLLQATSQQSRQQSFFPYVDIDPCTCRRACQGLAMSCPKCDPGSCSRGTHRGTRGESGSEVLGGPKKKRPVFQGLRWSGKPDSPFGARGNPAARIAVVEKNTQDGGHHQAGEETVSRSEQKKWAGINRPIRSERETGFEPATFSLGS